VDNTQESPTILSLCTGYGGIERGLERVFGSVTVLTHVEIEAFAAANLVNQMETGRMVPAPIWTDLKTFKPGLFRGLVDILTGGYPCQPFSTAGKRRGSEDERHLWPFVRETIRACQSGWVFLENVEGHLSKGIAEVLADLEEMAYQPKCGVFSAVEVGAPHQRKRVFILANRKSSRLERWQGIIRTESTWKNERDASGGGKGHELAESEYGRRKCFRQQEKKTSTVTSRCDLWPARPGELQHEWEEPRVATQSELGRTVAGSAPRTDRLRLLGNGVVPQTAEKAFITLYNRSRYGSDRFYT